MRKRKNNMFISLIILLLSIGLGYALLTQDLTINGITKVKGNNWDIHFNNVQVSSGSVALSTGDSAASIDLNDNTLVNYTVTLNQPGDYYEFTVDAVNAGTVDGMIGEIISKLNGVVVSSTNPLPSYLDYSVTYSSGVPIENNHLLAAGDTETYKVRVEFKRDIEESDLPTTDQTNSFSFGVSYLQKNGSAIVVPEFLPVYTANMQSPANIENYRIYIGQAFPDNITKFNTLTEASAAIKARSTFSNNDDYNPHFALKHRIENGIVTESYIEFEITPEDANTSGFTEGNYALRGIKTRDNNACLSEYYDSVNERCVSPYYESNKALLHDLFGDVACEESLTTEYSEYTHLYRCLPDIYYSWFDIKIYENGSVSVGDCYFDADGLSICVDPSYSG